MWITELERCKVDEYEVNFPIDEVISFHRMLILIKMGV